MTKRAFLKIGFGVGVLLALAGLGARGSLAPEATSAYYLSGTGAKVHAAGLLVVPADMKSATATLEFTLGRLRPGLFVLDTPGCVKAVSINGIPLSGAEPPCGPVDVTLDGRSVAGGNIVKVGLITNGRAAPLSLKVSPRDPLRLAAGAAVIVGILLAAGSGFWLWGRGRAPVVLLFAGLVGLAGFYNATFPYSFHGNDAEAHLDYIRYLMAHWSLPPADAGWEFFQPPLYYGLLAAWGAFAQALGRGTQAVFGDFETLSWLLYAACLAICWQIARELFTGKDARPKRLLFTALIGALPSFVTFSTRVTNDILLYPLCFLYLLLIQRWWKGGRARDFWLAQLCVGLGLLTKTNAALFLGVTLACVLLKRGAAWRARIGLFAGSVAVVALIGGAPLAYRFGVEGQTHIVGNVHKLQESLRVGNGLENYAVFNPAAVIRQPFNNPWDDSARRQHFWEFYFRSVFFGEVGFGAPMTALASCVVALGLAAGVATAAGFARYGWRDEAVPMAACLCVCLAASLAYRLTEPFSCNQDFRFVLPMAAPLAYFAVRATAFPRSFGRAAAYALWALVAAELAFVALLVFPPA
jgi:hypothetical protein